MTTRQCRLTVRRLDPSACLHVWRILGCAGGTVYGVLSASTAATYGGWLSHGAASAGRAWKEALDTLIAAAAEGGDA